MPSFARPRTRVAAGALLAAVLGAGVLVAGEEATAGAPQAVATPTAAAVTTTPAPAVTATTPSGDAASQVAGALYLSPVASRFHSCSGVVVHSSRRDLVATAAHCLAGTGGAARFAPGLAAGKAPYGRWVVRAAWVDSRWRSHGDPRADLVLLSVEAKRVNGKRVLLEDVVPGARLGHAPAAGTAATVLGYALGTSGNALECQATTTLTGTSPTVGCPGFPDGTSGGPWLTRNAAGHLVLSGLTSGLHQGGCTPDISYATPLGDWSDRLLARVERRPHGDLLPFPPSDGC